MSESDSIENLLENFNNIQEAFLDYLDNEENIDKNFENFNQLFEDAKIRDCKHEFRLFLHFILKVTNNRHHTPNFFNKIDRILQFLKDDFKEFKNEIIFQLFQGNKRILLFLIEEKILIVDKYFVKRIISKKYLAKNYPQYFAPEIKPFLKEKWFPKYDPNNDKLTNNVWVEDIKKELPDNFYENRKIGENDSYLCKLIREDLVEDFVAHVNRFSIKRNAVITPSIYETNSSIIKKQENLSLIEYAAFFGSIQIFTFLINEDVELKSSLWHEVIHGRNAELIHLLENNQVEPTVTVVKNLKKIEEESYKGCIKESIKCHHNEIANYFINNHLKNENDSSREITIQCMKYYNFEIGRAHV